MNIVKLKKQIETHEGNRLKPYRCTVGKLTIGIGRNIEDKGISQKEADFLFANDIDECLADMFEIFPDFSDYPENVQHVLIDMRFNLGGEGFRKFKNLIAAVMENDWLRMLDSMKNSRWHGQVGVRATNLEYMIEKEINKK